jgi:hypothetical protein
LDFSLKTRTESSFDKRKELLKKAIANFEQAVNLDPKDDLTFLFCALEYAEGKLL